MVSGFESPSRPLPWTQLLEETFEGFGYFPTSRSLALRVQQILNALTIAHPNVAHTLLLHNGQLVWSSVDQKSSLALHRLMQCALAEPVAPSGSADAGAKDAFEAAAMAGGVRGVFGTIAEHVGRRQTAARRNERSPDRCFVLGAGRWLEWGEKDELRVPEVFLASQQPLQPQRSFGRAKVEGIEPLVAAAEEMTTRDAEADAGDLLAASAASSTTDGAGTTSTADAICPPHQAESATTNEAGRASSLSDTCYRLVLLRVQKTCLALLLDDKSDEASRAPTSSVPFDCARQPQQPAWTDADWYEQLGSSMLPELHTLSEMLTEREQRQQTFDDPYRFIYFNSHNLAIQTSIRNDGQGASSGMASRGASGILSRGLSGGILNSLREIWGGRHSANDGGGRGAGLPLSHELCSLLLRVRTTIASGQARVIVAKSANSWVAGRASGGRELYLVMHANQCPTLAEVEQEFNALVVARFSHMFSPP